MIKGSLLQMSPLVKGMQTAVSGMSAQNQRVLVISQNMAHVGMRGSTATPPYQRKLIAFRSIYDQNTGAAMVKVKGIYNDRSPFNRIYAPEDPSSDANGYILETNVKSTIEMNDLREANRSHEANLKTFEKLLSMLQSVVNLLRN